MVAVVDNMTVARPYNSKITPTLLLLTLATFNVRGLSKSEKRERLGVDCVRYNVDIMALQETKTKNSVDMKLLTGHRLILFDQKKSYHYGLGFSISPRILECVKSYTVISDRVCYLDLVLQSKGGNLIKCRVVNAYGPTSVIAGDKPRLVKTFYKHLKAAINVPVNVEVFILGDFNATAIIHIFFTFAK